MSLILADARRIPLVDGCVQCCVSSPPYFGLRDYGVSGQIGLEPSPDAYVAALVGVYREVSRVLADDGVLWLNIGDSYAASGRGGGGGSFQNNAMGREISEVNGFRMPPPGYKMKDLIGIPWMVAFALREDGWYLRSDVIWSKPNPMPESVTDRPTKAHEMVFLLAKGQWVSRVVKVADLSGEVVHFGKHVGAKEPLFREPVTKFCVRLAAAIFDGAQRQHDFSLPPFYAQEWQQVLQGGTGQTICNHPSVGRLAALSACLLNTDRTTKCFLQEMDRFWLDLRAGDALLIGRVQSLLGSPSVYVHANGTVTVHDSGQICEFKFGHGEIVTRSTTTCSYFYDHNAIKNPPAASTLREIEQGYDGKATKDYDGAGVQNPSSVKARIIAGKRSKVELLKGANQDRNDGGASDIALRGFGSNARSVWTIATKPYAGAHFATMPEKLAERCILAGSRPGDLVLDPFGGSGTTVRVARRFNRRGVMLDLNPAYLQLAQERISGVQTDIFEVPT